MTKGALFSLLLAIIIIASSMVGCGANATATKGNGEPITVAAAADLQFAFGEIGELFHHETGRKVVFSFGSTGTLAKQIENGAPMDVFAAANVEFVDGLRGKGLVIAETQQLYGIGRIVLACNKKSGLVLRDIRELVRPEVRWVALANPEHAPYGRAAQQALEAAGVWDEVRPKLVFGENVSQAMQFVQTGNADAGIIALSVANVPDVDYVLIDQSLHQPLEQSMTVVASTKQGQASREFIAFVNGPNGRPIMKKYGFVLPGEF